MDLDRRWSGVSGPPESPAQRTRNLRSCVFRCQMPSCGAVLDWGPEVPRRWTGVSGPPESPAHRTRNLRPPDFSQLICIFVVLYWIGVRNTPGECPESPARPESPALWTGISGPALMIQPSGVWPDCPAQTGVSGHLHRSLRPEKAPTASFWGGAIKSPLLPQMLAADLAHLFSSLLHCC